MPKAVFARLGSMTEEREMDRRARKSTAERGRSLAFVVPLLGLERGENEVPKPENGLEFWAPREIGGNEIEKGGKCGKCMIGGKWGGNGLGGVLVWCEWLRWRGEAARQQNAPFLRTKRGADGGRRVRASGFGFRVHFEQLMPEVRRGRIDHKSGANLIGE